MSTPIALDQTALTVRSRENQMNLRMKKILKADIDQFEKSGKTTLRILKGISTVIMIACMVALLASTFFAYAWAPWAACGVGLFLTILKEIVIEPKIRSLEKTAILSKIYLEMIPKESGNALYPIGEADLPRHDPKLKSDKMAQKNSSGQKTNIDFVRLEGSHRDIDHPSAPVLQLDAPLPLKAAASQRYAGIEDRVSSEWKRCIKHAASYDKQVLTAQKKYQKAYETYEDNTRKLISEYEKKSVNKENNIRDGITNLKKIWYKREELQVELDNLLSTYRFLVENSPDEQTNQLKDEIKEKINSINTSNSTLETEARQFIENYPKWGLKLFKEQINFFKARSAFIPNFQKEFHIREAKRDALFINQLYDSRFPLWTHENKLKNKIIELVNEYNEESTLGLINMPKDDSLQEHVKALDALEKDSKYENKVKALDALEKDSKYENKVKDLKEEIQNYYKNKSESIASLMKGSRVQTPIFKDIKGQMSNEEKVHHLAFFVSQFRLLEKKYSELSSLITERESLYKTTLFLLWSNFHQERIDEVLNIITTQQEIVKEAESIVSLYRNRGEFDLSLDEACQNLGNTLRMTSICHFQVKQLNHNLKNAILSHPQTTFDYVQKQLKEANELLQVREKKLEDITNQIKNLPEKPIELKDKKEKKQLLKLQAKEKKLITTSTQTYKKANDSFIALQNRYEKIQGEDPRTVEEKRKESDKLIKSLNKLDQNEIVPLLKNLKRASDSHISRFVNKLLDKEVSKLGVIIPNNEEVTEETLPSISSSDTSNKPEEKASKEQGLLLKTSDKPAASKEQGLLLKRNVTNLNKMLLETDQKYRMMTRFSRSVSIVIVTALLILGVFIHSPWFNIGICAGFFVSMGIRQGSAYYLRLINKEKIRQKMQRLLVNLPVMPEIPGHRPELQNLKRVSDNLGLEGTAMTSARMITDGMATFDPKNNKFDTSTSDFKKATKIFARNVKKYNNPNVIARLEKEANEKKAGAQARLSIQRKYANAEVKARVSQPLSSHWHQLSPAFNDPSKEHTEIAEQMDKNYLLQKHLNHLKACNDSEELKVMKKNYLEAKKEYEAILDEPKSITKTEKRMEEARVKFLAAQEEYQKITTKLKDQFYS